MDTRKIIEIDEEKCTGCGACIVACAEGALEIIEGKARLVSDIYCDGLGACLGECPEDALRVITRQAPGFDEEAVEKRLAEKKQAPEPLTQLPTLACGCSSHEVTRLSPAARTGGARPSSALANWPVKLELVPVSGEIYESGRLLVAADCSGFALTDLHQNHLHGGALITLCPKLNDYQALMSKLAAIIQANDIKQIRVLYMQVPCCAGAVALLKGALEKAGKTIPLSTLKIGYDGQVVEQKEIQAA